MMRKLKAKLKLNHSGAALVTVIVVIAFISVLVTVILYASGMNYYMKATDMNIKESFYDAETALEEVKAALVKQTAEAFKEAYTDTLVNYASSGSGSAREAMFKENFVKTFGDNWDAAVSGAGGTQEDYLKTLVESEYQGGLSISGTLEKHEDKGYLVLRGISFKYGKDDYITQIETDFLIKAPEISWEIEAARTEWDSGDNASTAFDRDSLDMVKCVNYYNWKKK